MQFTLQLTDGLSLVFYYSITVSTNNQNKQYLMLETVHHESHTYAIVYKNTRFNSTRIKKHFAYYKT